jgi:hypothetical protein
VSAHQKVVKPVATEPTSDEPFALQHAAGWSVGDVRLLTGEGPVWLVSGTNGENRIEAHHLIICLYAREGVRQRPLEFVTEPGSEKFIFWYERVKPNP